MDRPKVTQGFLNRLETPTDMPDVPWIQWRVENVEEMYKFLQEQICDRYDVRARMLNAPGNQIVIQTAVLNSDLQLSPGDCLVIQEQPIKGTEGGRARLGIVRAKDSVPHREADGLKDHNNPLFMAPKDKEISH